MLAHIVVDTDDDLHILADGVLLVAAHLDNGLLSEQSESARYDEQRVGRRPKDTSHQKGTIVLDDLETLDELFGHRKALELAVDDLGAVRDTHDTARDDGAGILDELHRQAQQRVLLDTGVGVQTGEQRIFRDIDAGVQRVGLTAVCLLYIQKVGIGLAVIDRLDLLGRDLVADRGLDLVHMKGFDDLIARFVR